MKRTDLQALTLVGPTVTRPVQDPLAVLSLDNQLNIYTFVTSQAKAFIFYIYQIIENSVSHFILFQLFAHFLNFWRTFSFFLNF